MNRFACFHGVALKLFLSCELRFSALHWDAGWRSPTRAGAMSTWLQSVVQLVVAPT